MTSSSSSSTLVIFILAVCWILNVSDCFVLHDGNPRNLVSVWKASALEGVIESPVLKNVYPSLLKWKKKYGHPNIPLGTTDGRSCHTLRRLHIQQKLTDEETKLLESLGFCFHTLEDVYRQVDFEEMYDRLMAYEQEHQNGFQVPKKYKDDPELGAWVTGIRRLGPNGVHPQHAEKLNAVSFGWVSTRKCGSQFMQQFRQLRQRLTQEDLETMLQDPKVLDWIGSQRTAHQRGRLSETRTHYMEQLFGKDWLTE